MKKVIAGIASAIGALVTAKGKLESKKEPEPEPESNLVWISADDPNEPIFAEGEYVVTFNPYTNDYAIVDFDFSPLYFKITDVRFDEDDEMFRYKLGGNRDWFAEEWLMKPMVPFMVKPMDTKLPEPKNEPETNQFEIDYWLLTLHEAVEREDEKERKQAEEALKELTDK